MKIAIDLVANTGSFNTDIQRSAKIAEREARRVQAETQKLVDNARRIGVATATAFVAAGAALIAFVNNQAEAISSFQGLSEKIGDTADNVASLKLAADVSGVALDTVAAASVRLTASLAKQDEESKGAAEAIKALGLSFDEFKKLQPVDQLDAVAKSLAGFEDGAGKTAVAVALFGKAGAELIPFFNDLNAEGRNFAALTSEQIQAADQYSKNLARLKSQVDSLAQAYATGLIGVFDDTATAIRTVINETLSLRDETGKLIAQDALRSFAQGFIIASSVIVEAIVGIIRTIDSVRGSFAVVIADAKVFGQAVAAGLNLGINPRLNDDLAKSIEERNKTLFEANKAYSDLISYNGTALSDQLRKQFADVKQTATEPTGQLRRLNFNPGGESAAKKAADDANKKSADELKRFIDQQDSARKTLADLDASLRMQVDTFGQGEEAVLAYRLSLGDLSDEVQAAGPLGEEYARSIIERTEKLREAKRAQDELTASVARDRDLQAQQVELQRKVQSVNASPAQQRYNAGRNEIDDKVNQQRQTLEDQRRSGQISPDLYQTELAGLQSFQDQAVAQYNAAFDEIEARSRDFGDGFKSALESYADNIKNLGSTIGTDLVGALDQAISRGSDLAANALLWGKGGVEAAKAIGRDLITSVVSSLIKVGAQYLTLQALQLAGIGTTTTAAGAAAAALAGIWTPAAVAASIATLGGAAATGTSAYVAAIAAGTAATTAGQAAGVAFADGGLVSGPGSGTSDSILAKISNGEYVMKASAVSKFGPQFFDALNEGQMPMFANGGGVGRMPSVAMRSGVQGIKINVTNTFSQAEFRAGQVRQEEDGTLTVQGFIDQISDPGSGISSATSRRIGNRVVGVL